MVVAVLEEERHDEALKHVGLEHLPTSAVRHPGDDIMEFLLGQNGVELDGELLDSNGALEIITIVVVVSLFLCVLLFRHGAEVAVLVQVTIAALVTVFAFEEECGHVAAAAGRGGFFLGIRHGCCCR